MGELLFFTVGIIALLVWAPAWMAAIFFARRTYRILLRRGASKRVARASGGVVAFLILLAYIPVYVSLAYLAFYWDTT